MKLGERPLVRVGAPAVEGVGIVELTCSACPTFGADPSTSDAATRTTLCWKAWRHAEDVHDGDVDREGWT